MEGKKLADASPDELREAADILIMAASGVVTHGDRFKTACRWGAEMLFGMIDDEAVKGRR